MKQPLLTASLCLWASHFLAAGPTDHQSFSPLDEYDRLQDYRSDRQTLDYLLLAYDIADVFIHENVMNLEHDDNNRCMFVKTEEGIYSYTSPTASDPTVVCGLYIVAEPSQLVEFQFMEFSVSCPDGGLVSLIDGWELNGQFFPSEADHELPRDKRYMEFCGAVPPVTRYVTAQNVGLVEFRIPISGQGFRVRVKFHDNPKPCNVVIQFPNGPYTIQNFGRRINCSVSILFPSTLTLTAMSIAIPEMENMTLDSDSRDGQHQRPERECSSRGLSDYVEIRGGRELDPLFMAKYNDYCGDFVSQEQGVGSSVQRPRVDVGCGNTVMRLVSSGTQDNSVSFLLELFFDTQTSPCPRRKTDNAG